MISEKSKVKVGAIYGRVSVDDAAQVEHGSLEQQEHLGREHVRQLSERLGQKMEVRYTLIEERGFSGATTKRPKYQELMRLIVTRKIDFIVAKEISRLTRSIEELIRLMNLCREHDVALYIRGLDIEPNTHFGKMLFQFMGMLAELERDMVVTRTRESRRSAAINNGKIGGGPTPLGFDKHPTSKGFIVPNEAELKQVVFLMEHFAQTASTKQVLEEAKRLGIKNKNGANFNYNSIKRLLKNEKYIGLMRVAMPNGDVVPVNLKYGCVVPQPLFDKVQERLRALEGKVVRNRVGKRIYLLSGLMTFEDGSALAGVSGVGRSGERYHYYRNKARTVTLDALAIEKAVLEKFRASFSEDKELESCVTQVQASKFNQLEFIHSQTRAVESELREVEKQESTLIDAVISSAASRETVELLNARVAELKKGREELEGRLLELGRERNFLASTEVDARRIRSVLGKVFAAFENATPAKKRGLLQEVFHGIKVFRDNRVEIRWSVPTGAPSPFVTDAGGGRPTLYQLKVGGAYRTRTGGLPRDRRTL